MHWSKFDDQIWIEVNLQNKDTLLCGCIYRSPTNDKNATIESTVKVCNVIEEAVQRKSSHLLICGDFNYPTIDWVCDYVKENSIAPFIETAQNCFLHQHVFEPTRYRGGNEPSLLDLIFSNEEGMVYNLKHESGLGESDHTCFRFTLKCYYNEVKQKISWPNYFKADCTTIRNRISQVNWISELQSNFTTSYIKFVKLLEKSMEGCVPKFVKKRKRKTYT